MRILISSLALFITANMLGQTTIMHVRPAKNPGSAFVMGLLVPGAGQMYNDQVEIGTGVLAVSAGLIISGASIYGSPEYSNAESVGSALMVSGGVVSFGAALFAAFNSRAINRRNGMDDRAKGSARLMFGPGRDGIGFAYRF
jgi:hypothetical protein